MPFLLVVLHQIIIFNTNTLTLKLIIILLFFCLFAILEHLIVVFHTNTNLTVLLK